MPNPDGGAVSIRVRFSLAKGSTMRVALLATTMALCLSAAALAQNYPVKAVRIIVPVAPGGGTDPQARLLGKKFQESMGQPFVIENRTGAGSMIGTEFVAKSAPDGYTLLCGASTLAGAPALRKDLPFDLLKDLIPVGQISYTSQFLVVHSSVPVATLQDFIALAKKQGGKMNAASGGIGSANGCKDDHGFDLADGKGLQLHGRKGSLQLLPGHSQ